MQSENQNDELGGLADFLRSGVLPQRLSFLG